MAQDINNKGGITPSHKHTTMNREITIHGFKYASICSLEASGLAKCFEGYAENSANETIEEIGFNPNSGYVYIALENGIQICSGFGNDVEYLVVDFDSGEEHFLSTYWEAEQMLEQLYNNQNK